MAIANYDYSQQLENLKAAQQKAQMADLQNTRDQALSNLAAEQQQNAANYAAQRSTANAQNRLSAKNFQEYLANTGRANSGLGAQASMQYNNNLNTSLNNIYGAENAANADILRRRTDASNAYNSGLAAANANIEANYIQALLDEKAKAFDRQVQLANQQLAEKEFKESIRQFNENLKLQKQQLQQRFSSGSGGGSSRSGAKKVSGGSSNDPFAGITSPKKETPKKNIKKVTNKKGTTYIDESTISKNPKYTHFSFSINDKKNKSKNKPVNAKITVKEPALLKKKK